MEAKQGKQPYPLRKVTQEKLDNILACIQVGIPIKYAAESNGITKTHFYNLINQGLSDLDHGIEDTFYAELVVSLRKLEKKDIGDRIKDIINNEKGHRGAEWYLEHRFWREFGNNAQVKELADEIAELKLEIQGAKKESKETEM